MQKCGKRGKKGRGEKKPRLFLSPSLGFINGAAPELCGSERLRQPWKEGEEERRERKRERE